MLEIETKLFCAIANETFQNFSFWSSQNDFFFPGIVSKQKNLLFAQL